MNTKQALKIVTAPEFGPNAYQGDTKTWVLAHALLIRKNIISVITTRSTNGKRTIQSLELNGRFCGLMWPELRECLDSEVA